MIRDFRRVHRADTASTHVSIQVKSLVIRDCISVERANLHRVCTRVSIQVKSLVIRDITVKDYPRIVLLSFHSGEIPSD